VAAQKSVTVDGNEAANPLYDALPEIMWQTMNRFAEQVGRQYHLFDYVGAADAREVVDLMGSGEGAVEEVVERLMVQGDKLGLVKVRLYRPFDGLAFVRSLPKTVRRIAVLDRTKEPGALAEHLYLDVPVALSEYWSTASGNGHTPRHVFGGRYGLASKEFTHATVAAVCEHLREPQPKKHFTVGIYDDATHLRLTWDQEFTTETDDVARVVCYGLGSDDQSHDYEQMASVERDVCRDKGELLTCAPT
jgi:pyruvate-ferredoxin/flavodoxin oxidoreductase